MEKAVDVVRRLGMERHPEGGFFNESYRAAAGPDGKSFSTAIYFLLAAGDVSRLHRLKSDEVWHFYDGGPLTVAVINPKGKVESVVLGRDHAAGERLQYVVPAGCWFGAFTCEGTAYSLVGCTVAPGFDFADFEMGVRSDLLEKFPSAKELVLKLTA